MADNPAAVPTWIYKPGRARIHDLAPGEKPPAGWSTDATVFAGADKPVDGQAISDNWLRVEQPRPLEDPAPPAASAKSGK